jgi:hypothetical protein
MRSDTILSRNKDDEEKESNRQALYKKSTPFRAEDCAKWGTATDLDSVVNRRKQIYDRVTHLMSTEKKIHWTDVIKHLFALYDRMFLDGKLGRMLDRANVSIQVIRSEQIATDEYFKLHLHLAVLESLEFPASVCGIVCEDRLAALQVGLEHQIVRLIAQTGCNTRVTMPASPLSRTDALASGLFGHIPPPHKRNKLHSLPASLVDLIGRLTPSQSLVQLARTSRSVARDVKDVPVHNEWVPMSAIGSNSVGHFRSVRVRTRQELENLPLSVTDLQLEFEMNEKPCHDLIIVPSHVRVLYINCDLISASKLLRLPEGLLHLTFGAYFNQPVENLQLPNSLTHLTFGLAFDQLVEKLQLPESLTHLTFDYNFNQPIEELQLPTSLTHLAFDLEFDWPIEKLQLPASLTHLTLGTYFNHPVEDLQLPDSLTHLTFSHAFDWPVGKLKLPPSLTHLTFGDAFNQPIEHLRLPASLTHLTFDQSFNQPVEQLQLPASLTHLTFGESFNQPVEQLQLPASLTHLTFGEDFDHPVAQLQLPISLTHLTCGNRFSRLFNMLRLPESLTHLTFEDEFNQSVEHLRLPASLTHLTFGRFFDHPVEQLQLPTSLTHLTFGRDFDHPVEKLQLPKSLTHLTFGMRFNQSIKELHLPSSSTRICYA